MSAVTILSWPEPDPVGALDLDGLQIRLAPCPAFCQHQPGHPDAVDTPLLRHRSRALMLDPVDGGIGDRTGRATTAIQVEQFADRSEPPMITHAIEVQGTEAFVTLSIAEAEKIRDYYAAAINQAKAA